MGCYDTFWNNSTLEIRAQKSTPSAQWVVTKPSSIENVGHRNNLIPGDKKRQRNRIS